MGAVDWWSREPTETPHEEILETLPSCRESMAWVCDWWRAAGRVVYRMGEGNDLYGT